MVDRSAHRNEDPINFTYVFQAVYLSTYPLLRVAPAQHTEYPLCIVTQNAIRLFPELGMIEDYAVRCVEVVSEIRTEKLKEKSTKNS